MKRLAFTLIILLGVFSNSMSQTNWSVNTEKDVYGDEILGSKYVFGEFQGTFSNGLQSNLNMKVGIGITKNEVMIMFFKYGKYSATFDTDWNFYIRCKKKDGKEVPIEVKQHAKMLTVLNEVNRSVLIDLLKKETSLKCYYIECTRSQPRPSYNFTINCNGFTKAYKEALESWL